MMLPISEQRKTAIQRFLCGNLFPPILCCFVLIGHFCAIEFFTSILFFLSAYAVLLFCDTTKPLLVILITFIYQLSVKNSPSAPSSSTYLFTGYRLVGLILLGTGLIACLVIYFLRTQFFKKLSLKKTPLLLPLLLFFASQITGGLFSGNYSFATVVWGGGNALALLLVFLLLYVGMQNEDAKALTDYFSVVCGWVSFLLFLEVAGIYLFTPDIISESGAVQKKLIFAGWAISNPVGLSLAVLIPIDLYPALKSGNRMFFSLLSALAAWGGAFLTLSRNAILFGSLALLAAGITCIFRAKRRKLFLCISSALVLAGIVLAVVYKDFLTEKLHVLIISGISSAGRTDLWSSAIASFFDAPLFGKGFFNPDIGQTTYGSFIPEMAHNTFFELLAATGIFGYATYLFYRIQTVKIALTHRSIEKWMLLLSVLVLLAESMLDVFMFSIYPTFAYSAAMAIICLLDDQAKKAEI